ADLFHYDILDILENLVQKYLYRFLFPIGDLAEKPSASVLAFSVFAHLSTCSKAAGLAPLLNQSAHLVVNLSYFFEQIKYSRLLYFLYPLLLHLAYEFL